MRKLRILIIYALVLLLTACGKVPNNNLYNTVSEIPTVTDIIETKRVADSVTVTKSVETVQAVENASERNSDSTRALILVDLSGSMKESYESFINSMKLLYVFASLAHKDIDLEFYFFTEGLSKEKLVCSIKQDSYDTENLADNAEGFKNNLSDMIYKVTGTYTHIKESIVTFEENVLKGAKDDTRILIFSDMSAKYADSSDSQNDAIVSIITKWVYDTKIIPWKGPDETPAIIKHKLADYFENPISLPEDDTARIDAYGRFLNLFHWLAYGYSNDHISYKPKKAGTACRITGDEYSLTLLRIVNEERSDMPEINAANDICYLDEDLNIEIRHYYTPQPTDILNSVRPDTDYIRISFSMPEIQSINIVQEGNSEDDGWSLKNTNNQWKFANKNSGIVLSREVPISITIELKDSLDGIYAGIVPELSVCGKKYQYKAISGNIITYEDIWLRQYDEEEIDVLLTIDGTVLVEHNILLRTSNKRPKRIKKNNSYLFDIDIDLNTIFSDPDRDALIYEVKLNDDSYTRTGDIVCVKRPADGADVTMVINVYDGHEEKSGMSALKATLVFSDTGISIMDTSSSGKNSEVKQ